MEVINVSQQTANQLAVLDELNVDQIQKIFKVFMQLLIIGESKTELDAKWKAVCDSLGVLLLEAAKTKTTEAQLKGLLFEKALSPSTIDTILSLYSQHGDMLVSHLSNIGIHLPHLVGVEWRLDYAIRSKQTGKENVPLFFVCLKVKEDKSIRDVLFLATLEEMQDLLAKVKDAVKQVERVLTSTDSS